MMFLFRVCYTSEVGSRVASCDIGCGLPFPISRFYFVSGSCLRPNEFTGEVVALDAIDPRLQIRGSASSSFITH